MRRGEVWLINLDPAVGAEIKKTRPAVIVNDDVIGILPLKVIVPVTEWKDRYAAAPWMVRLDPSAENGLEKTLLAADAFQVRSVAQERFVRRIGKRDSLTKPCGRDYQSAGRRVRHIGQPGGCVPWVFLCRSAFLETARALVAIRSRRASGTQNLIPRRLRHLDS